MNCPKCHAEFHAEDTTCPACKLDLAPYLRFLNAGRELHRMKRDVARIQETLNTVEGELGRFRDHLFPPARRARPHPQPAPTTQPVPAVVEQPHADPVHAPEPAAPVDELQPADLTPEAAAPMAALTAAADLAEPDATHPFDLAHPAPVTPASLQPHREPARRGTGEPAKHAAPASVEANAAELGFGQKWILIAGVVITLLGLGYFLKYSFDRNWIPEWGRVALAYVVSLFVLALGGWFSTGRIKNFGLFLMGGGIGMLYLSSFAGYGIYHLIGQPVAFGLMVAVTALSVVLALRHDAKWLAILGQLGGFLTPLVLATHQDNQLGLMSYLLILNLGLLAIAFYKQWTPLHWLNFVFTWLIFAGWTATHYDSTKLMLTLVFLNLFFLIHAVTPYLYFVFRPSAAQLHGFGITVPNSFLGMAFNYGFIAGAGEPRLAAIVSIFYALLFLGMARALRKRTAEKQDAYVLLLAQAGLFLVITAPLLFSGGWITAAWTTMAAVTLFGAVRLNRTPLGVGGTILLLLALGKLFFWDVVLVWRFDPLQAAYRAGYGSHLVTRYITFVVVLGSLAAIMRLVPANTGRRAGDFTFKLFTRVLFGLVLFAILNIETAAAFAAPGMHAQTTAISILWALCAMTLMMLGFRFRAKPLRVTAILLLAFTAFKVLLWDMADVETPFRILSFVVLGVMMIGISYLYHRYADRLMNRGDTVRAKPAVDPAEFEQGPDWDEAKRADRPAALTPTNPEPGGALPAADQD